MPVRNWEGITIKAREIRKGSELRQPKV